MNRQISELTNLVLALTEKISSSNREGNELNTVSNIHEARSDRLTGVQTNNNQPNPMRPSTSHYPQSSAHQIDDIVTEIHHLRDTMTDNVQHPKTLHTQVPLFRGNREKYTNLNTSCSTTSGHTNTNCQRNKNRRTFRACFVMMPLNSGNH